MSEVAQRRVGIGAGDSVCRKAEIRLQIAQRKLGMGAEDGVFHTAEKTQGSKRLLKLQDVMPMEVRHAQVQRAVAEVVRRIDERRPDLLRNIAGDGNAHVRAKIAHRLRGALVVDARDLLLRQMPDRDKTLLHILDGSAAVADLDRIHYARFRLVATSTGSQTSPPSR